MTIHQFPTPQANPDHVWPPIRQSPGIDWHHDNDNRPLPIGQCVLVWIGGCLLGWMLAIGSGWTVARILELLDIAW